MSDTPHTDQLEDSDFHKYSDDDAVPLSCYHRMTAHARVMEASLTPATKMLGEAWEELKATQEEAKALFIAYQELKNAVADTLEENRHLADGDQCTLKKLKDAYAKSSGTGLDSENDQGHPAGRGKTPPKP